MAQGIFIQGGRPKSKKAIKEALLNGCSVHIESTSMLGNDYDGLASEMPEGKTVYFVGPDPYKDRKFYGQITRKGVKVTVV